MMRLIGAFVLTYFLSRLMRRAGLRPPNPAKLVAAHVLSLVILTLLAIALRQPLDVFRVPQLWVYVVAQGAWLLLDLYRAQVAFWKPPVAAAAATGSSQTKRSRSTR